MDNSKYLLCAGTGQLNRRVADLWKASGHSVIGFRRSTVDESLGFEQRLLDLAKVSWPDVQADTIVIALSAGARTESAYREAYLLPLLKLQESLNDWQHLPRRVVVVSSTRVYAEDRGGWVNDDTPPAAADALAQILIDMEAIAESLPVPAVIMRLSGIYGPGRDWLKRMALQAEPECPPDNAWTNRIHIDDAARAIVHVLTLPDVKPSYLVSDTEPQSRLAMYNYFRRANGLVELDESSVVQRGKRIKPERLMASGFDWLYPTAFSGGYANN